MFGKGEFETGVQITSHDRAFGGTVGSFREFVQLFVELFFHLFRQFGGGDLFVVFADLVIVVFAEFRLDCLDLLAEEIVLLTAVDLLLHLRLNIVLAGEDHALFAEGDEQFFQPRARTGRFQHALLVFIVDQRTGRRKVGKGQRVLHRKGGDTHLFGKGRVNVFQIFELILHFLHQRIEEEGRARLFFFPLGRMGDKIAVFLRIGAHTHAG